MTTRNEIPAQAGKPGTFQRENKYLVLKWDDITNFLTDGQQLKLDALITKIRVGRLRQGKDDQSYVCIAADWPMYEQVWSMVEAFVDGKPNEIEQLQARITELEAHNAELWAALLHADAAPPYSSSSAAVIVSKALASTPESALADILRAERERCAKLLDAYFPNQAAAIRQMED